MTYQAQYTHAHGTITATIPGHPDNPSRQWLVADYMTGNALRKEINEWARSFDAELPAR